MKFLSIGAGAIGSYIGGSLIDANHEVCFLEKREIKNLLIDKGILLDLQGEIHHIKNFQIEVRVNKDLLDQKFDICLLAIKSYDTEHFLKQIIPFVEQFPPILCLQNGVENETKLSRVLGQNKVIPATVTSSIAKHDHNYIQLEKKRGIGLSANHPLSTNIMDAFNQARLNANLYLNPLAMKWSKMLTNLLGNASSAILNMTPAEIYSHPQLLQLEIDQLRETLSVMSALGLKPVNLPKTPVIALTFIVRFFPLCLAKLALLQTVGKGRGNKMPSFHIDLYSGNKNSEVNYLNGAVVRIGKSMGIATPINQFLLDTLTKLISGKIPMDNYNRQPEKLLKTRSI